jgi:hypothetical protein
MPKCQQSLYFRMEKVIIKLCFPLVFTSFVFKILVLTIVFFNIVAG